MAYHIIKPSRSVVGVLCKLFFISNIKALKALAHVVLFLEAGSYVCLPLLSTSMLIDLAQYITSVKVSLIASELFTKNALLICSTVLTWKFPVVPVGGKSLSIDESIILCPDSSVMPLPFPLVFANLWARFIVSAT